jgi:hypothetical protein
MAARYTHGRAHTDTAPRAYNKGSASTPLAKGCASAGVARFYLRHSSAKGVHDEKIYLRGGAVFMFFLGVEHVCTRMSALASVDAHMYAHAAYNGDSASSHGFLNKLRKS